VLLYSYLYSIYFSLTSALNNVSVSSSAIVFGISALAVISHDFAGQPPCASSYLYSTHFSLIRTLYALSMLSSASFFVSSPATVLSLGFAGHTFSTFSYLCLLCFPLVYAFDTVPMLLSVSFLERNLVNVISLDCAGQNSSLTMCFDSGYALVNARCFSPCSLDGLKVFPLSFVLSPASPVPITLTINWLYSTGLFVCRYCNRFWRIRTSLGSLPPTFFATSVPRQADLDFLGN